MILFGFSVMVTVLLKCAVSQNEVFTAKCIRSDEDCLTRVAQAEVPRFTAGNPDLKIVPLDPFELKNYTADLAGLVFSTTGKAKGYKNAVLEKISFDFERKLFRLNARFNITLKGNYRGSGRLFFLPVEGNGDIRIKAVNAIANITSPFDITLKNGKKFLHFGDYDLKFEVRDSMHFTLTNLFNGNKELSDAMHHFLNTNWKLVSNEFASPVVRTGIDQLFENLNSIFETFPLDDIFLD